VCECKRARSGFNLRGNGFSGSLVAKLTFLETVFYLILRRALESFGWTAIRSCSWQIIEVFFTEQ
jgi:hypothetical protein